MEKDIVIEQLRAQLKQSRSRMAAMEEEQAADTAPLEGLLSQLGELKVRNVTINTPSIVVQLSLCTDILIVSMFFFDLTAEVFF